MDDNINLNLKKKTSSSSQYDYLDYENYDEYEDMTDLNLERNVISSTETTTFIDESELLKLREKVISEAMDKLYLPREEAILALIFFKWNTDNIDLWYDNIEQNREKAGIELSEKSKKELKAKGIPTNGNACLICFEEYDEENKDEELMSLSCGHKFCKECWEGHLQEILKTPMSSLISTCPQLGCTCIIFEDFFKKILKDKDLLEKLDKAIFKNFINHNINIKQCPNPKCHLYVKSDVHSEREINCPCKTSYCFKCSRESHRPCNCEMIDIWTTLISTDVNDDKWIQANTKKCPHCGQRIQKSQGCNYMLCDKRAGGCGFAFCYVCETDWAKHSQDHFNCNKYTDAVKKKEANAKRLNEELKRLDFYSSRYLNLKGSVIVCNKKFRDDLKEKTNILIAVKKLPTQETYFIFDGLDMVIKAKKILQHSYIFGYFMKDNMSKELFELKQGMLELNTERLHQLLAYNNLESIIQEDRFDTYNSLLYNFRNNVNNLISSINKFLKGLLDDIEIKFIADLNQELLDKKK